MVGRKKSLSAPELDDGANVFLLAPGEAPQPLTLNHPASSPGRVSGRGSLFAGRGRSMPRRLAFKAF